MAYASERARGGRFGAGAAVVALHAGLGAALLSTFAGGIIGGTVHNALDANDWTWAPPPPAPPEPPAPQPTHAAQAHAQTEIVAPRPPLGPLEPLAPGSLGTVDPGLALPPLDPVDLAPRGALAGVDTAARPAGPALAARAKGDPGAWITRNDYPTRAIREEWTGITRLRLGIGSDGRVAACDVTAGSGHAELDAVACDRVTRRARFEPARSADGTAMAGAYETSVRWVLQD
ncbi:energy transducer TonB [Novosphingobium huizhouense]|uniref:energy transducer TonB n=1 Tax=Novosphingobium huizhouense TaxID=2866625 RepID=UPI001CD85400|nr:energy transducer TonB [Novosphingobium huizhouense]